MERRNATGGQGGCYFRGGGLPWRAFFRAGSPIASLAVDLQRDVARTVRCWVLERGRILMKRTYWAPGPKSHMGLGSPWKSSKLKPSWCCVVPWGDDDNYKTASLPETATTPTAASSPSGVLLRRQSLRGSVKRGEAAHQEVGGKVRGLVYRPEPACVVGLESCLCRTVRGEAPLAVGPVVISVSPPRPTIRSAYQFVVLSSTIDQPTR